MIQYHRITKTCKLILIRNAESGKGQYEQKHKIHRIYANYTIANNVSTEPNVTLLSDNKYTNKIFKG